MRFITFGTYGGMMQSSFSIAAHTRRLANRHRSLMFLFLVANLRK